MRKLILAMVMVSLGALCRGENWPHWRGPAYNGSSPERDLPREWSKTSNVAWSATMPGPSAATPVVWGEHVFVSSTDPQNHSLVALCLDRKSGSVRWQHKVGESLRRDDRSTFSAPSPVTDGQRVFFFYGNGELWAFDLEGRKLWSRNIEADSGAFAFLWTFSSSPLLFEGRLYLQVLQRDVPVSGRGRKDGPIESYLLAMDPASGKTLWQQARPCAAAGESREAFSSPVPWSHQGRQELLIVGGDCLSGHDPASGRELWRWGTWNPSRVEHWRLVPSPVAGAGVILACGPKGSPVFAVKAGGMGELGADAVAWKTDQERTLTSDVPTPLFYLGDFFILSDLRKTLARLDSKTGAVKWSLPTPGQAKYEASPTGADGRIFLMNFKGEVTVVDAGEGKVLQTIAMGEPGDDATRSSIVPSQGQLFIRTNRKLYCIGAGR